MHRPLSRSLRRLAVLGAVVACQGGPDDDKDDGVDTDEPVVSDTVDSDDPVDTDTGTVDRPGATSTLTASGPQLCADPTRRENALFDQRIVTLTAATIPHLEGGGAAIGDLTGDGRLDVVVVGQRHVWMFPQDLILDATEPVELLSIPFTSDVEGFLGASVADHDDDGDLDLLVTGRGVANHLLANDGTGQFTDVTDAAGLGVIPDTHHTAATSWSDWDGDGDLDLFVAGHGYVDEEIAVSEFEPAEPSYLFENDGDGTFTDVSDKLASHLHDGYTFLGGWFDADGDGDDDLYLVNDFGAQLEPCRLVYNEGGTFTADMNAQSMDAPLAGMGFAVGDYDGDGDEDIAVPAWRRNVFFQSQGGAWFEVSQSKGWAFDPPQTVAWGSEFMDIDNDGLMDLSAAFGYLETGFGNFNVAQQPDGLWLQTASGGLVDRAATGGFDDVAPHRSMVPADLNEDGWLDVVKMGLDGKARFYFSNCGEAAWMRVRLSQPAPNTQAVGATVRLFDGDRQWMRRVRAGGTGYGSGLPPELHFGLGDVVTVDRMVVEWPDGHVDTWYDLEPRQELVIER